jgi:enoyl-CoA hydratase/carnithine racemase
MNRTTVVFDVSGIPICLADLLVPSVNIVNVSGRLPCLARGPLGIKTTLESAHLSIDESEAAAFARLGEQFGGLFHTEDFIEGRKAEAEGRPPVYQGK